MSNKPETYLSPARVAELWAAVQDALGKKAGKTELSKYATPEVVADAIASALSDYATTSAVKSAIVAALADYMTESEVTSAIAAAAAASANIQFKSVDKLPATGEANVIYLVPSAEDSNVKNQSMWIDGKWVSMGSTTVDLANYWSKDELRPMTAEELAAILV